jgi:inner membrane protein
MASDVATGASRVFRSPGLKFLAIAALTVAMALPLFFINLALSDREQSANGAAIDIATGWGGTQTVAGPVLIVPYTVVREESVDGKVVRRTDHLSAVLLPEDLGVDAGAVEETRWRGIFSVPVYRADIGLRATFAKAAIRALVPADATILWDQVSASVLVTDAHGLADNVALKVNGRTVMFQPGSNIGFYGTSDNGGATQMLSGMSAPLGLTGADDLKIDTRFTLRGSRELSFAPLGRRTTAHMRSGWASPSFFGAFLPTERSMSKDGFTASWVVPYLARGFGQSFDTIPQAASFLLTPASGVKFYQPVDHYQLVDRSLKYAILFIALAFLVFFVAETVSPKRLHVVQYALVGAAQVLFYLLLLSFSEHVGFATAYLIGAIATVVLTSLYAGSALKDRRRAAMLGVILAALYALLYAILNAVDFALLIGSCLLFVALAATMYVTRGVDWYGMRMAEAA